MFIRRLPAFEYHAPATRGRGLTSWPATATGAGSLPEERTF